MKNVDITDFSVEGTSGAGVTAVNPITTSAYDVTVSGGGLATFNGTVGLNLGGTQDIEDYLGNDLPAGEPATDHVYLLDNAAPVIAVPADIIEEGTGPTGAVVSFVVTAVDAVNGPLTPSCNHNSGDLFPLGKTTITCSATDALGNIGIDSFDITVGDKTGPFVNVPANITEEATGPTGAVVTFVVTATDTVYGPVPPSCDHNSGDTFPLGTTTVTCTASDPAGNAGTDSFDVTVQDTTGPSVNVPPNITEEATGPTGAVVTFVVTATDTVDGPLTPSCDHNSGDTFPVGTTTVTCTATDAAGNAGTDSFDITVQDKIAPSLLSFTRQTPATSTTDADTLIFRVTLNEDVQNLLDGAADFTVDGATTATVMGVAAVDARTYDVTVSGGDLASFNGIVGLNLAAGQNITDLAGNPLPSGEPGVDQTYLLDNTGAAVTSILRQNPLASLTNLTSVSFRVTFAENVQNLDTTDFSLATSGTATGTINSIVVQSGSVYDIVVTGANGEGTLDLNFAPGNDIADLIGNPVGPSPAIGSEETYTIDTTRPSVTISQAAGQDDPSSVSPVNFAVVFSESVSDFTAGDVTVSGTAGATIATVTEVAPTNGTTYNAAVTGMVNSGTVVISIAADVAQDAASNGNTAFTSLDNSVTFTFATTTTLTSSPNPSGSGEAVTFTATVTSAGGAPTGTVTFRDGTTPLGTGVLSGSGEATFTISSLMIGTHTITAEYGGDANFSGSVSTELAHVVQAAAPGAIPTMTEWGMILLMALIATVSVCYLRRRTAI